MISRGQVAALTEHRAGVVQGLIKNHTAVLRIQRGGGIGESKHAQENRGFFHTADNRENHPVVLTIRLIPVLSEIRRQRSRQIFRNLLRTADSDQRVDIAELIHDGEKAVPRLKTVAERTGQCLEESLQLRFENHHTLKFTENRVILCAQTHETAALDKGHRQPREILQNNDRKHRCKGVQARYTQSERVRGTVEHGDKPQSQGRRDRSAQNPFEHTQTGKTIRPWNREVRDGIRQQQHHRRHERIPDDRKRPKNDRMLRNQQPGAEKKQRKRTDQDSCDAHNQVKHASAAGVRFGAQESDIQHFKSEEQTNNTENPKEYRF